MPNAQDQWVLTLENRVFLISFYVVLDCPHSTNLTA